jgi:hypothetical protein
MARMIPILFAGKSRDLDFPCTHPQAEGLEGIPAGKPLIVFPNEEMGIIAWPSIHPLIPGDCQGKRRIRGNFGTDFTDGTDDTDSLCRKIKGP